MPLTTQGEWAQFMINVDGMNWIATKANSMYLRGYETVPQLQQGLGRYFPYYNEERLHQALEYRTPAAVYRQGRAGGRSAG